MSARFWRGYAKHLVETTKHKGWVAFNLARVCVALAKRAVLHDLSKYRWREAEGFAAVIFDLRTTSYGTPEYAELLKRVRPSIDAHYAANSHHPEHHGGYAEMPILDRVEMLCDWAAAVRRHADGDLDRSITQNAARFGYDEVEAARLRQLAVTLGLL